MIVRPARSRRHLPIVLGVLCALLAGCGGPRPPGVSSIYDPSPDREDFFALPWPSDERLVAGSDGRKRLDLAGFYNPGFQLGQYLDWISAFPSDGFGTSAAIYFRFDGPLDPASLPATAAASIAPDSSVYLIDVTPTSPEYRQRRPIRVRFTDGEGVFIGPDSLALLPEPGFPLRERTTYAAVVSDRAVALDGGPVSPDPRFAPPAGVPLDLPEDAVAVVATVFTTGEFTSSIPELRDAVHAQTEAPVAAHVQYVGRERNGLYDHYEGTYSSPNFQEGEVPYQTTGGQLHRGPDGRFQVVRTEQLRFALTVPRAPMPPAGWPIVVYAHGTNGQYTSFVRDGSAAAVAEVRDEQGAVLTRMAMISTDQVLHGPRDPTNSDPELTFYNFQNLLAAQSNARQGAVDLFQMVRLVEGMEIAAAPRTRAPIRFDHERIYFKGHSQGSGTGALFVPFEPAVRATVLSGAGANLTLAFLGKTKPVDIPGVVGALLGESQPIDEFHPFLNLIQFFFEPIDPGNYARFYFAEPPPAMTPRSVFLGLGLVDHFTPVPTIKALALALGVTPVRPELDPIDPTERLGSAWAEAPVEGNVAAGRATGVVLEYAVPLGEDGQPLYDGHHVVQRDPAAVAQSNTFLGYHAARGSARLIPRR